MECNVVRFIITLSRYMACKSLYYLESGRFILIFKDQNKITVLHGEIGILEGDRDMYIRRVRHNYNYGIRHYLTIREYS